MITPVGAHHITPLAFSENKKAEEAPATTNKVAIFFAVAIVAIVIALAIVKKLIVIAIILLPAAVGIGFAIHHFSKTTPVKPPAPKPVVRRPLNDKDLETNRGYQRLLKKFGIERFNKIHEWNLPDAKALAAVTPETMPAAVVRGRLQSDGRPYLLMNYRQILHLTDGKTISEVGVAAFAVHEDIYLSETHSDPMNDIAWVFVAPTKERFKYSAWELVAAHQDVAKHSKEEKLQDRVVHEIHYFIHPLCFYGMQHRDSGASTKATLSELDAIQLINPKDNTPFKGIEI